MIPGFADDDVVPWTPQTIPSIGGYCNICRWSGPEFASAPHTEGNHCPDCGSIARERFLHRAWIDQWSPSEWAEVIENSPRLGGRYRDLMTRRLRYHGSDFDERAHRADIRLDLQSMDLGDDSIDVLLSSHVLEHVPDTSAALAEIHRVLAPGGLLVLQVPLLEPQTIVPPTPEFHGDDTPVFWRFGWDLTDRLEDAGFDVTIHGTETLATALEQGAWPGETSEFDLPPVIDAGRDRPVEILVPREHEPRLGFETGYGLVTWTAAVPGSATPRPAPSPEELRALRDTPADDALPMRSKLRATLGRGAWARRLRHRTPRTR